jgi:hypothetical protein
MATDKPSRAATELAKQFREDAAGMRKVGMNSAANAADARADRVQARQAARGKGK